MPVTTIAHTIATSSVIPYMWIDSGPISIVPVDGDGNAATRPDIAPHSALLTATVRLSRSIRARQRQSLAAALDELEGEVQVDLGVLGELDGRERLVPGLQQLARPPGGDPVGLGVEDQLGVGRVRHRTTIGSPSPF